MAAIRRTIPPAPRPGASRPPYLWLDLKLLAEERFILQAPEQSVRIFTDAAFTYAGIKPRRCFIVENMETAVQMAAEGYGVAFNYESYVRYFDYENRSVFLVGFAFHRTHFRGVSKGRLSAEFIQAFIRLLETHFN